MDPQDIVKGQYYMASHPRRQQFSIYTAERTSNVTSIKMTAMFVFELDQNIP